MNLIPQSILNNVVEFFRSRFDSLVNIDQIFPVSGGSINYTFRLKTTKGNFFIKWNDSRLYPLMLEAEAEGLTILRQAKSIEIPEVLLVHTDEKYSFILLEWIESGKRKNNFFEDFGFKLSHLHSHTQENFGLDKNNYIGSLRQNNHFHSSWSDFFILERLEPQLKSAHPVLDSLVLKKFNNLFKKLPELFPGEKPALLHGDLWNGNYLTGKTGEACLIDPAVYYGHREMDIAMTRLFGGFDSDFYESYNTHFPLEKGWQERMDICNLYPLLLHVNLFGSGYTNQVKSILNAF